MDMAGQAHRDSRRLTAFRWGPKFILLIMAGSIGPSVLETGAMP